MATRGGEGTATDDEPEGRREPAIARRMAMKPTGEMGTGIVSVILPVFNGRQFLASTIESVLGQTWTDYEVIIVDDGSTDGSYELALAYAERSGGRVRVHTHPHHANRGVSASRNLACREARGEYLAFIDADDEWAPEKLEKQMMVLVENADVGLCYSLASIERSGYGVHYAPGKDLLGDPPVGGSTESVVAIASARMMFFFSTLVVRRSLFERTGRFAERLPFQDEDRILVGQLCSLGRAARVAECLCVYRVHDSSATARVIREKLAGLVDFDIAARLMIWVAGQPGGRELGRRIFEGPYLSFLRACLREGIPSRYWWLLVRHVAKGIFRFPGPFLRLIRRKLRLAGGVP
jgi:glycosyltransferase involved in cell wall biosynthesis